MRTEGIAAAYKASGWCGRCGGKRDTDGNCVNCDRWYNHPLLTLGGGLTVALAILMFVGIRAMRDADPGFARFASGSLYDVSTPAFVPSMPTTTGYTGTPRFFQPAAPLGTVASVSAPTAPKVSTMEAQFAELEALRTTVHTNERSFRSGVISPGLSQSSSAGEVMSAQQATSSAEIAR